MRTIRSYLFQARGSLLWGVGGLVVLQLVLDGLIEWQLPRIRNPKFADRTARLQRNITEADPAPLVVMLGSSRTQWGFDAMSASAELAPRLGKRPVVFNFGLPGGTSVTHLLILHELLEQDIQPDLLLVEVTPPCLRDIGTLQTIDELAADRLVFGEIALLARCGFSGDALRKAWCNIRLMPWYSYRKNIIQALLPDFVPWSAREPWMTNADAACWWNPPDQSLDRRQYVDRARRQYTQSLRGIRIGGPHCQALREILETCRREQLRCALVLMPEGTEFQTWYDAGTWPQLQVLLDGLSRQYGISIINARGWVSDDDFLDQHHMLAPGARAFSTRLAKEAILPLLRRHQDFSSRLR